MNITETTLGSVSKSIQTGPFGSQLHSSDYSEEGTPVIMPQDIVNWNISEAKIARVDDSHVIRLRRHKCKKGEIIYPRRGDLAKCAYISDREVDWLCGTGCLKVSVDETLANPKFIYFHLQLPYSTSCIENATVGSTMPNLNSKILSKVKLRLPSIEIQNAIVNTLSTYDNLIDINLRRISILEEMAIRTYIEWFVHFRFSGHNLSEFSDGLPVGWHIGNLSEIGKFKRGKNITIGEAITGEYPVVAGGLNPSCYHNDFNAVAPVVTVSASGANAGYTRLYQTNLWAADCSYIDKKCPNTYFLYCFLKTNKDITENLQIGSAQPHVHAKDLNRIKCVVPSNDVINDFIQRVKPIFEEIRNFELQNYKLQQMRDQRR